MKIALRGIALAAVAFAASASAQSTDLNCKVLDGPGAVAWTQGWEINEAGQVALGSDAGGFIYAHHRYHALPAPAAGSGFSSPGLTALGINDFGVVGGAAWPDNGGPEQSFYLAFGRYTFFSSPYPDYPNLELRALSNRNIATLQAHADDGSGLAVIYNPLGTPPYAPGFTVVTPSLPGKTLRFALPGAMNDAGKFVGTAKFRGAAPYGFIYDPAAQDPFTIFQIAPGVATRARGINNRGQIVGAYVDGDGNDRGYLLDAAGFHTFNCAGAAGIFPESINDRGQISGDYFDAQGNMHGFVAHLAGASDGDESDDD